MKRKPPRGEGCGDRSPLVEEAATEVQSLAEEGEAAGASGSFEEKMKTRGVIVKWLAVVTC